MMKAHTFGSGVFHSLLTALGGAICSVVAAIVCQAQSPLPDSFNPGAIGPYIPVLGGQQSSIVESMAVQTDGKVLVTGEFSLLGGLACANFGRVNVDGSVDTNFLSGAQGGPECLAVQPDGKILVGGPFSALGGQACTNLARLNPDGTLDAGFKAQPDEVDCLAVQSDGKILASGGGNGPFFIERLNADGSPDTNFNPMIKGLTNAWVFGVTLQPDGRILVSGRVTEYDIPFCTALIRLNADGTSDTNFNPLVIGGVSESVRCTALQADGGILVGGQFSSVDGLPATNLARLNADGTVDTNFNAYTDVAVSTLALQADGKIVVGGAFTMLDGVTNYYLGRLNRDGSLDAGFNPEVSFVPPNSFLYFDPLVCCLAAQPDGKILVGGVFSALGNQPRICIGRLNSTGAITNRLSLDAAGITWWRGGDGPEVWRTSFDGYTSGAGWVSLGAGARISGGWQLTGIQFPTNTTIRARGYVESQAGLNGNGASWFVETILGPPVLGLSWSRSLPLLNLTGPTGQQCGIQFVPWLAANNSWQSLTNFVLTNSEQSICDPAGAAQRFYRMVVDQ